MSILNMVYGSGGSGIGYGFIDLLVVGGGGSGGAVAGSGGGGGGGVIECEHFPLSSLGCVCYDITIGSGGASRYCRGLNGGDSCAFGLVAYGGGAGGCICDSRDLAGCGGSGGGANAKCNGGTGGLGCSGQGNNGGNVPSGAIDLTWSSGGGGGGAGGSGCNGENSGCSTIGGKGGNGGPGKESCISGEAVYYGPGGGGGASFNAITNCPGNCIGCGGNGSGDGGYRDGISSHWCGKNACLYGGGGGGGSGYACGGAGCQGVVILRYKTNGSCGLKPDSFGGCKYECGEYTIHCFTDTTQTLQFIPVFK